MRIQWLKPLYAADGDGGSGGGAEEEEQAGGERPKPSDILNRYGKDRDAALRMAERVAALEGDNFKLREKNRTLRDEVSSLKGKAAPEGAVVLSDDDAKEFEAYKALGKPTDLQAAVSERDTLKTENAAHKRAQAIQEAAQAHGYKAAALSKLPSLSGRDLLLKDATGDDGKPVKRAFVAVEGKEVDLPSYIQQHDPELVTALTEARQTQGTSYVPQSSGGQAQPKGLVERHLERQAEQRKAHTNPLMKQRTA